VPECRTESMRRTIPQRTAHDCAAGAPIPTWFVRQDRARGLVAPTEKSELMRRPAEQYVPAWCPGEPPCLQQVLFSYIYVVLPDLFVSRNVAITNKSVTLDRNNQHDSQPGAFSMAIGFGDEE
jgi:hypothetical protein